MRARLWRWSVVLAAAGALPFFPALANGFVNWDDQGNLVDNPHFRGLGPAQLWWMFTTFHKGHYQPLTWLSFALDWLVGGMEPIGYHAVNIALHAASVVLLWRVLLDLRGGPARASVVTWLAMAFAALMFGVHPLRVESVAWATERRDVLSGVFWLWTVWLYLRAARSTGTGRARLLRLALIPYALSLLSKAWGITLPVVLLVLDWYPLRRFATEPQRVLVREKLPFALLALPFAILAMLAQRASGAALTLAEHGLPDRVAQAGYGLCFYLGKLLVPIDLSPLYPLDDAIDWSNPVFAGALVLATVLTAVAWHLRARAPWWLASWALYVIIVAPVLGLTQSGGQLVADRYSYLALIPVAGLAGVGLERVAGWRPALWIGGAVLAALAALSARQCGVWHDSVRLWQHVARIYPDCQTAHYNLGAAFDKERRDPGRAMASWRRALELRPSDQRPRHNLALLLAAQEKYPEAIREWQALLAAEPRHPEALYSVGLAYFRQGHLAGAEPFVRQAVAVKPDHGPAWQTLGDLLAMTGRPAEARTCFTRLLELEPASAYARACLQRLGAGPR